jgi:hypothetical protein
VADSADARIVALAAPIRDLPPLARADAVLRQVFTHVPKGSGRALDASTAVRSVSSSCMSHGNVGTAVGRAAGLPTRTIGGYLVDRVQQTHAMNEFHLGGEAGWVLGEPQAGTLGAHWSDLVAVRRVLPADEAREATRRGRTGMPLRMTIAYDDPYLHRTWSSLPLAPEWPGSDHLAEQLLAVEGDADTVARLVTDAATAWERARAEGLATGDPGDPAVVASFVGAADLPALEAAVARTALP